MITKKIRAEFAGILALISALKRAWKAFKAYNKAIKAVSTVITAEPIHEWEYNVSKRTPLSYGEAQYIYKFVTEESDLYMRAKNGITEFVIDQAGRGYRYYEIIGHLRDIDTEINAWMHNKLIISQ